MSISEYNLYTKTWRILEFSQLYRYDEHDICTLDNKIFSWCNNKMLVLDLDDDEAQWRYIAGMNKRHFFGVPVMLNRNIYTLAGNTTSVEMYDVDQGKLSLGSLVSFDSLESLVSLGSLVSIGSLVSFGGHMSL